MNKFFSKTIKIIIIIFVLLSLTLFINGCNNIENGGNNDEPSSEVEPPAKNPDPEPNPEDTIIDFDDDVIDNLKDITNKIVYPNVKLDIDGDEIVIDQNSSSFEISENGEYILRGLINLNDDQIKIAKGLSNVILYFDNVEIIKETDKKVINGKSSYTIVLVDGTYNTVKTTYNECDAIGSDFDLTILGNGFLNINATDNGIVSDGTLMVIDSNITINSIDGHGLSAVNVILNGAKINATTDNKDAIHAECNFDDLTEAPSFDYSIGYVYIINSDITTSSNYGGDGIQADTFVFIASGNFNITSGGGTPNTITEASSNNADGKGIKASTIDWGENDNELITFNYTVYIQSGTFTINCNDDAIHSDGGIYIAGGKFNITCGDDGIHAESILKINYVDVSIDKCYEGIEAAKIEINGGYITINSTDDGINAADGTENRPGHSNSNCNITINNGIINVNANGDGIDSNGNFTINGGEIYVSGPTRSDNNALDADGTILVNSGKLMAVGTNGMLQIPSNTSKSYIISIVKNASIGANKKLTLVDEEGNELISLITTKSCYSVIIGVPELTIGNTYKLLADDIILDTFTVTSKITSIGNSFGGPGGQKPPRK